MDDIKNTSLRNGGNKFKKVQKHVNMKGNNLLFFLNIFSDVNFSHMYLVICKLYLVLYVGEVHDVRLADHDLVHGIVLVAAVVAGDIHDIVRVPLTDQGGVAGG